jgi:hypothetical protein
MTRPTIIKQANPFRDFVVDDRRDDPPANGASRQGDPWPCHLDETFSQIHEEGEGSGYEPADSGHAAVQQARTGRDVGAPPEAPVKPPAAAALRWHGEYTPFADRRWLVKGILPEQGVALLAGQWGAGKTFCALDLAGAVILGAAFAGRRIARQGGVLFLAAEGASEIPIRLNTLVQEKIKPQCSAGINPGRLPFTWADEVPKLKEPDAGARLAEMAEAADARMQAEHSLPLALIIIDTLAAAANWRDANDAAETQGVMNTLAGLSRATGALVVAVDHFGKQAETGVRGSSAKEGAADAVLACIGEKDLAGNVSNLRLAVRKLRGGSTGAETAYSLRVVELGRDRDGEPITSCVVDWTDRSEAQPMPAGQPSRWPTSLKVFKRTLETALTDSGREAQPFGDGPKVRAVDQEAVRREFYAVYPAHADTQTKRTEAKGKAFRRALKDAADRSLIGTRDVGGTALVWLLTETKGP